MAITVELRLENRGQSSGSKTEKNGAKPKVTDVIIEVLSQMKKELTVDNSLFESVIYRRGASV